MPTLVITRSKQSFLSQQRRLPSETWVTRRLLRSQRMPVLLSYIPSDAAFSIVLDYVPAHITCSDACNLHDGILAAVCCTLLDLGRYTRRIQAHSLQRIVNCR